MSDGGEDENMPSLRAMPHSAGTAMICESKRSTNQLRRFFAVVKAAFDNWPERHHFQPDDPEHLRAWLLVMAKHRTIKTFHLSEDASEIARVLPVILATMLHKHCWCKVDGTKLDVCVPRSISITGPHKTKHLEFCEINKAVDEIILVETGLDPERLLQERDAAA